MGFPVGGKETDVLRACIDLLRLRGALVVRVNGGGLRVGKRYVPFTDTPGCSDILACVNGRFAAVEVKRPDGLGRVSRAQLAFLNDVLAHGGLVAVVNDVAQLNELLDEWGL